MRCLQIPSELLNVFSHIKLSAKKQAALIKNAKIAVENSDNLSPSNKIACLKIIIKKIQVGCEGIDITLSCIGMVQYLLNTESCNETSNNKIDDGFVLSIPTKQQRCSHETKLVIADEYASDSNPTTTLAIQNALKKALIWNQVLTTGEVSNMAQLAKQENVTQRYIAHLIKLAFLAPDIMDSIMKGNIPPKLSLDRLKKGIPLDWKVQRLEFGFTL